MGHWINFLEVPVNGGRFNTTARYLRTLAAKDEVRLVREPNNEHDRHAVAVVHGSEKLGYIPASMSRNIASLMDGGFPLRAKITLVDPSSLAVTVILAINDRS